MITGASSGIGEVVAHRVGRAGATVILIARTSPNSKSSVTRSSTQAATRILHGRPLGHEGLRARDPGHLEEHGRVDILVNNAGRSIRRSLSTSYDRFHDFERTMQLNYFGALKMIMTALPGMRQRKYGRIINISSIGAQAYPPRFSHTSPASPRSTPSAAARSRK